MDTVEDERLQLMEEELETALVEELPNKYNPFLFVAKRTLRLAMSTNNSWSVKTNEQPEREAAAETENKLNSISGTYATCYKVNSLTWTVPIP